MIHLRKIKFVALLSSIFLPLLLSSPVYAESGCKNSTSAELKKCLQGNPIVKDLNTFVNVLSGLVGIVVIGSIILGGIQYSIAGDNPQAVTAAKKRITNALIALLLYISIFSLVQWLIPGGLFSK